MLKRTLIAAALSLSASVGATEFIIWDKKAQPVSFKSGVERIIEFPSDVTVGVPSSLSGKVQVNSAEGVVHFKTLAEFPQTRFTFVMAQTGRHIYLDISSKDEVSVSDPSEDVVIKFKSQAKQEDEGQFKRLLDAEPVPLSRLVQHASRDWFAPDRLKLSTSGVGERLVSSSYSLDSFWLGESAGLFSMKPLKEYYTTEYTLTAVLLKNRTLESVVIPLKNVYPSVKAVVPQHMWLGPKGSQDDTTILYVVSEGYSFLKSEVYSR
ncbi:TIGR03749 family integrating conjugative element protein [Vibrio owensii]|uniref:TIGR03749 family integrating conjugative element protein n=1 Tax=Vibrio owensii TaxID=696485 RepID=UPI0018F1FDDF|nr:TIGR03749 family integrating conjugative element protein [Vibrio owensii]